MDTTRSMKGRQIASVSEDKYDNGKIIEDFRGISGESVYSRYDQRGTTTRVGSDGLDNTSYCVIVQKISEWSFQSNDAEVGLLQEIDDYLREKKLSGTRITLYMRGSKGPCSSCKELIQRFRKRFPNIKVICEYSQKSALERDEASKSSGQQKLTYGYEDAALLFPGQEQSYKKSYCKVYPAVALGIQVPQGLKGFKMANLEGFFTNYTQQYGLRLASMQQFVKSLSQAVVSADQRSSLANWLTIRVNYERHTTLSQSEIECLYSIESSSSGNEVIVYGRLTLSEGDSEDDYSQQGSSFEQEQQKEKMRQLDSESDSEEKTVASEILSNDNNLETEGEEQAAEEIEKTTKKKTAGKQKRARKQNISVVGIDKKWRGRTITTLPGIGIAINVSGDGMNCLIRALLVAAGQKDDEATVGLLREELIRQKVSQPEKMLDLASQAGAILVSYMEFVGILSANKTIIVCTPDGKKDITQHVIYGEKHAKDPLMLWLSDEHFQAILPGKKA